MKILSVLLVAGLTLAPLRLTAHDGPEHEIDELTERIKNEGESADLLLERAIEYNVLNKTAEATKDLERALHYESHSPIILRELSRTYFATGKTNEAKDTASRGLEYAAPGAEHASLLMLRAEIARARKDYTNALADTNKAIQEHPESGEWYIFRGQLHRLLGQKKERIAGLAAGLKGTGGGLLETEWLDALIDGGKAGDALAKIEEELQDARIQSTWLLRRARARLALKKNDEAKSDLEAALKEINERVGRGIDPLTLLDRGQIYELLGKKDEAKKDYEAAQGKGVTDEWLHERLKAVKGDNKKKPGDPKKPDAKKEEPPKEGDDKKDEEPKPDDKDKPDGDDAK